MIKSMIVCVLAAMMTLVAGCSCACKGKSACPVPNTLAQAEVPAVIVQ